MPFQWIADNLLEVVINGLWTNGRPVVNVLHFKGAAVPNVLQAENVRDAWQSELVGTIFTDNYTLDSIDWVDKTTLAGTKSTIPPNSGLPTAGIATGESLPPGTACLVNKNIVGSVGTRKGRMFLPPQVETVVNENGIIAGGNVATMQLAVDNFLTAIQGFDSMEMYVVHKVASPVESTVAVVTSLQVDPLISSMRRRLRG